MAKPKIIIRQQEVTPISTPVEPSLELCIIGPSYIYNTQDVSADLYGSSDKKDGLIEAIGIGPHSATGVSVAKTSLPYDSALYPALASQTCVVDQTFFDVTLKDPVTEVLYGSQASLKNSANSNSEDAVGNDTLVDSAADFVANGVKAGDIVVITSTNVIKLVDTTADFIALGVTPGTHTITVNATPTQSIVAVTKTAIYVDKSVTDWNGETNPVNYSVNDGGGAVIYTGTNASVLKATDVISISSVVDANTLKLNGTTRQGTDISVPGSEIYANWRIEREQTGVDQQLAISVDFTWDVNTETLTINPALTYNTAPIVSADVLIRWRGLRQDIANKILTLNTNDEIETNLGGVLDVNPLALASYCAFNSSGGARLKALAVESDDIAGYNNALSVLESDTDVYYMVPLSQDTSILEAVNQHVLKMNDPDLSVFRCAFTNLDLLLTATIVDKAVRQSITYSTGNVMQDPSAPFGDVLVGDLITITENNGNPLTFTATVNAKLSDTTIQLSADPTSSGITNGATEYEITRDISNDKSQQIQNLINVWNPGHNDIVRVWPSTVTEISGVTLDSTEVPGYYLAAAVAGVASGGPVHKSLSYQPIAVITDLKYSLDYFMKQDLETLEQNGWMVFIIPTEGALPYTEWQVTSTASEFSEGVVVDYVSRKVKSALEPYKAGWNITEYAVNSLRATVEQVLTQETETIDDPKLGPVITYYENLSVEADTTTNFVNVSFRIYGAKVLNGADVTISF